ncbi:MAG: tripartite tricarboxylate transporter TctB family protein [Rudaea sp.]
MLAAAVVLTWKAMHFGFTPRGDRPGPDVWPRAILALVVVTCLVRIVGVLRRPGDRDPVSLADVLDNPVQAVEAEPVPTQRYPLLLGAGVVLTIAYVALLGTLGFFSDTVLYIAAMARAGRYRRWPVIVAVALTGALAFMFVFMKVVYLSLPLGVGPFETISLALMRLMGIR